ncbi:TadE/TadG family type IV pilus assembly protein [Pararhizobium mangrovi]|nr:TadE/TadG family type IV pilus assembly protein [Pararhizobium mangrovi]
MIFRGFTGDRRGATAIEFAILGPIFFLLTFAILETGLLLLGQLGIDQAAKEAARIVRINKVANDGMSEQAFRRMICNASIVPITCSKLQIDLHRAPSFASFEPSPPVREGKINTTGFQFDPGAPGTIMEMRVYYAWPLVADLVHRYYSNIDDGNYLISWVTFFRNEPKAKYMSEETE